MNRKPIDIVLSGTTALAYWRNPLSVFDPRFAPAPALPARRSVAHIAPPSAATIAELRHLGFIGQDEVQVFVGPQENFRKLKGVTCTICKNPLPAHSLVQVTGGVYVVSPEMLFVQLAAQLDFFQLLALGHEFCGTYRMTPGSPTYNVDPLTSVSEIQSYTRRANGLRGQRDASRATKWLANNSASPAETSLSIMFRLPYRFGGYGLGNPLLNHTIDLNETATGILGRKTIRSDFFWLEQKHPAEYDGPLYHASREQAEYDELRRNAYAAMGMAVTIIRPHHLRNLERLDEVASTIRKNTGIRQNRTPLDYELKRSELFDTLFAYWNALDRGRGELDRTDPFEGA